MTPQDLQAALVEAHNAGDEDTAMKIAQMITAGSAPRQVHNFDSTPNGLVPTGSPAARAAMSPISGMNALQQFLAGAGQSVVQTGRGLKQLGDMAADAVSPRSQTLSGQVDGQTRLQQDQDSETDSRKLDAPLNSSGWGIAGNVAGNIAQFAVPGRILGAAGQLARGSQAANLINRGSQLVKASPWTAAAATGATMGAIAPTAGDGQRWVNTLAGAAGGVGGQALGMGVNAALRTGVGALEYGAQQAANIAKKYGIPLSLPDLTNSRFVKYFDSATAEAPGSGAEQRHAESRRAFNDALGRSTGIPTDGGPIDMSNWTTGRRVVGSMIGDMADNTQGLLTPQNFADIQKVLTDAQTKGSADTERAVSGYVSDMFRHMEPVPDPLPGGPIASIPGDAWREIHTDLGDRVAAEGSTDLGNRLSKLHGIHMDVLENGMSPDDANLFRDLRGRYARIMTLQPLAEKAPLGEGIDPKLVLNRAIADGNAYDSNGNMWPLGELGQLAKKTMTAKVPNSGTPIRAMIHGAMIAPFVGGEAYHQGQDKEHSAGLGAATIPTVMLLEAAGNRALGSRLLAKYAAAQMPEAAAAPIRAATSVLPLAGAAAATQHHPEVSVHFPDDPDQQPQGHADGGQVLDHNGNPIHKSTFWDLVKQGWSDLTGGDSTPAPSQAPIGSGIAQQGAQLISGRQHQIDQAVTDAGG
jgi:hypothetical protein